MVSNKDKFRSEISRAVSDPYFFKPLYTAIRKILKYIGSWPEESIKGIQLKQFTNDHDIIRRLVAWNFLTEQRELEIPEYEPEI